MSFVSKAVVPSWMLGTALIFALLNFLTFVVIAAQIGGDAWNGHSENGRYFLDSHGHLTEVSHFVFSYSYFHVVAVFATWPVGMLSAYMLERRRRAKSI